jgi:endonuclease/exonuclease/phosphatase (EEP) superfamily protein YafD
MHYRVSRKRRILDLLFAAYPSALLALSALHVLAPQRGGLLAISQVGALWLFVPLLLLVPWLVLRHTTLLRWSLLACAAVFCLRFGPSLVSLPVPLAPDAATVRVLSWNVLYKNHDQMESALLSASADVVALQECVRPHHSIIQNSAALRERYPYQFLAPRQRGHDTCMLSVYPILAQGSSTGPSLQWTRLDLGGERTLLLVNTHLNSGDFSATGYLPTQYDPSRRDRQIVRLRAVIDPLLLGNEPLLLVGDFNTTEGEVAYNEIARGLTDAHREVGWGTGHSWRLKPSWPFGLIRIDYQWGSSRVTPVRLNTDCTPRGSDHCMLTGTFVVQ